MRHRRLDGELIAAIFVAVSIAALLHAARSLEQPNPVVLLGVLAGVTATAAVLMKQNFVDAFVFAAVLLAVGVATRTNRLTYRPRTVLTIAGRVRCRRDRPTWPCRGLGDEPRRRACARLRDVRVPQDATAVMANWSWTAPERRLDLLALAVPSGLLVLLFLVVDFTAPDCVTGTRWVGDRRDPRVEVFGVFAGGNFWPHYLIALIPMVALTAGLSVHRPTVPWRWTRA